MNDLNQLIISGTIKNIKNETLPSGRNALAFKIKVERNCKNSAGKDVAEVNIFDVTAYGRTNLKEGDTVRTVGKLKESPRTAPGQSEGKGEIIAEYIELDDPKSEHINQIIIEGYVYRQPEQTKGRSGTFMIPLATSRSYRPYPGAEEKQKLSHFNIAVPGEIMEAHKKTYGEEAAYDKLATAGRHVRIVGNLKQDGSGVGVVAEHVEFLEINRKMVEEASPVIKRDDDSWGY